MPSASLFVVVLVGSYCCCALSSIMKLFGRSGKSSESPITAPVEATSPPINNQEDQNIGGGGGSGFFRKRLGTGSSLKSDVEDEGIVLVDSNPSSSYTAMKDEKSKTLNNDHVNNNNNTAAADETVSVVSDGDLSSHVNALKRMASSVLPKVAPLPAKAFFCLTVWCAIP